mgnify:CR=1 FL=1
MDIAKAFGGAFNRKIEKNWEKNYVVVDIHDTILRASYENEETYDYFPYSREALQLMTNREDICLIGSSTSSRLAVSQGLWIRYSD